MTLAVVNRYRAVFGVQHVASVLVWGLLGRLHFACTALMLTFLVADWTGSYASAGAVVGALTVAHAIAGPRRGRSADRGGAVGLLVRTTAGYAIGLAVLLAITLVAPPAAWPLLLPVAFAAGLSMPPVVQVARAAIPRLLPSDLRSGAYGVDATMQELTYVLGPLAVAATVAGAGSQAAVVVVIGLLLVGCLGFAGALHRADLDGPAGVGSAAAAGWRLLTATPGLLAVVTAAGLLVCGLISVDLVIVAWARDRGEPLLAGALAAVWSIGSLAGGLIVAGLPGPTRVRRRFLASTLGMAALVPLLPPLVDTASPLLVGVVLALGGSAVAPALAAVYELLADLAPDDRRAEVFGWGATASTTGAAIAAPTVGVALDVVGPAAGAGLGTVALALGTLVVFRVGRRPAGREVPDDGAG